MNREYQSQEPAPQMEMVEPISVVSTKLRPTLAEPIVIRPRHPELSQPAQRPIDKSRLKQRMAMIAADRPRIAAR